MCPEGGKKLPAVMRMCPEPRWFTTLLGDHILSVWTRAACALSPSFLADAAFRTWFSRGPLVPQAVSVVIKTQRDAWKI